MDRFSEYRIMWVLVFFDLPTETKKERKIYVSDRLTPSINFQYAFLSLPAKRILWYIGH